MQDEQTGLSVIGVSDDAKFKGKHESTRDLVPTLVQLSQLATELANDHIGLQKVYLDAYRGWVPSEELKERFAYWAQPLNEDAQSVIDQRLGAGQEALYDAYFAIGVSAKWKRFFTSIADMLDTIEGRPVFAAYQAAYQKLASYINPEEIYPRNSLMYFPYDRGRTAPAALTLPPHLRSLSRVLESCARTKDLIDLDRLREAFHPEIGGVGSQLVKIAKILSASQQMSEDPIATPPPKRKGRVGQEEVGAASDPAVVLDLAEGDAEDKVKFGFSLLPWTHQRLFGAWAVEQQLPLFEGVYPDDSRPRAAVQAAKDFAHGLIDKYELANARMDAVAVARSSTRRQVDWELEVNTSLVANACAWITEADAWFSLAGLKQLARIYQQPGPGKSPDEIRVWETYQAKLVDFLREAFALAEEDARYRDYPDLEGTWPDIAAATLLRYKARLRLSALRDRGYYLSLEKAEVAGSMIAELTDASEWRDAERSPDYTRRGWKIVRDTYEGEPNPDSFLKALVRYRDAEDKWIRVAWSEIDVPNEPEEDEVGYNLPPHQPNLPLILKPKSTIWQIGPETGKAVDNGVATYYGPRGSVRLVLYRNKVPLSCLHLLDLGRGKAKVNNVYTVPSWRRKGLAARLMREARKTFRSVTHSGALTQAGEAWSEAVGARTFKSIKANPKADEAAIRALAVKQPLAALRHPNCPVDLFWQLAKDYPLEVPQTPLFGLLMLETPDRWRRLEEFCAKTWITERIDSLSLPILQLFASDCAAHVLPIFETKCPDERRPRQAIETLRRVARGGASLVALAKAKDKADDAAYRAYENPSDIAQYDDAAFCAAGAPGYAADLDQYAHPALYDFLERCREVIQYQAIARHMELHGEHPTENEVGHAINAESVWQWHRLQDYLRAAGMPIETVGARKKKGEDPSQPGFGFDESLRWKTPAGEQEPPALTLEKLFDVILGPASSKKGYSSDTAESQKRAYDAMTPQRYGHMVELLDEGVDPELIQEVERRIHASGWLQKRARLITEEDLERLASDRPWEKQ